MLLLPGGRGEFALKEESRDANQEVEADGKMDGTGFAKEAHEQKRGGQTGRARAEGVDRIEQAD